MQPAKMHLWLLILLALPALTCQTVVGTSTYEGAPTSEIGEDAQPSVPGQVQGVPTVPSGNVPQLLGPAQGPGLGIATAIFSEQAPGRPSPPSTARIAFVATSFVGPGGGLEIFVMNPDGTGTTNITWSVGDDGDPAWSPDGKKIAFHSKRDGNFELYIMNADGSDQRRLTNTPNDEHHPSWSPDASRIVFSQNENNSGDLWVMNVDGSGLTRLTSTAKTNEAYPDWSPDGEKIVFSAFGGGQAGIYTMRRDGSNVERVLAGPLHNPQWSPDGSNLRGITPRQMICNGTINHPSWSPDGKRIVFHFRSADPQDPEDVNLFVIHADGSGESQLTHTNNVLNYGGFDPDWSPVP